MNNLLPSSTRKPGGYAGYDTTLGSRSLPANPQRLLILAQKSASGALAAAMPTAVFSDVEAAGYSGPGSFGHLMVRAAIKANPLIDITLLLLADAAGSSAASQPITFAGGAATGPGVCTCWDGNKMVQFAVAAGDTDLVVAAALNGYLAALSDLPHTSAVIAKVVTLTAKCKGIAAGAIPVTCVITAPGLTVVVGALVAGAVDPDITAALAAIFAVRYHCIASQFTDNANRALLQAHLDTVSGKIEQRGAKAYLGCTGIYSAAVTLGIADNFERFSVPWLRGSRLHPCELAAAYASYRALVLSADPSLPVDDELIPGVPAPPLQSDWLSRGEQEGALHNGLTPLYVDAASKVRICRAITTYMTLNGNPDEALLDDNPIAVLDYVRDVVRAIPKPKKASPRTAASYHDLLYARLKQLAAPGVEILNDIDTYMGGIYKARLTVEANPMDRPAGWFKVRIPAPVVPGLHIVDETIELYV